MTVYELSPLRDARWDWLVCRHPYATVFHDVRWLQALRDTYGYEPIVFTTSSPSDTLANGWVFCNVDSWLTGRRLVSLPFSDHCDPLLNDRKELDALTRHLEQRRRVMEWKYVEARPYRSEFGLHGFCRSDSYVAHHISLEPPTEDLFDQLHKDSIKRKIRRAEREGVTVEADHSGKLLDEFYDLQLITRRRHGLPPQPRKWFRNLITHFEDDCTLYLAKLRGRPIASIITLRFRNQVVYKYGASDALYHSTGAMALLFWQVIQRGKDAGLEELDLGRCDLDARGLMRFKEHLGARAVSMHYFRLGAQPAFASAALSYKIANAVCSWAPALVRETAGTLLYRHVA